MRNIDSEIKRRFLLQRQVRAENADPGIVAKVKRPIIVMTKGQYIERTLVGAFSGLSTSDIAVKRTRKDEEPEAVYIAYIADGTARIRAAKYRDDPSRMVWDDAGFSEYADDVSIAFDGQTLTDSAGELTYTTDENPWVFWVSGGALKAKILNSDEELTFQENDVQKVSAIRATGDEYYDPGLVVFFLIDGTLYYKQLIDGEWTDYESTDFGPEGVVWADIAAFRTRDFRVGVQAKTTTGEVYELFARGPKTKKIGDLDVGVFVDENNRFYDISSGHIRIRNGLTGEVIDISEEAAALTVYDGARLAAVRLDSTYTKWKVLYEDGSQIYLDTADFSPPGEMSWATSGLYFSIRNDILLIARSYVPGVGAGGAHWYFYTFRKNGQPLRQFETGGGGSWSNIEKAFPISDSRIFVICSNMYGWLQWKSWNFCECRYPETGEDKGTVIGRGFVWRDYYSIDSSRNNNVNFTFVGRDDSWIYAAGRLHDPDAPWTSLDVWVFCKWNIDNFDGSTELYRNYESRSYEEMNRFLHSRRYISGTGYVIENPLTQEFPYDGEIPPRNKGPYPPIYETTHYIWYGGGIYEKR